MTLKSIVCENTTEVWVISKVNTIQVPHLYIYAVTIIQHHRPSQTVTAICKQVLIQPPTILVQHNTTTVLRPFVRDYPGEPVPEGTLIHPPSWSSSNLCQLLPSTTIHSILLVQITCLAIFLHNLFPCPLVYLLVWSPPPHIPYISSPNQCLLFAAHAHTITTCFGVLSILYNLFLVFLSTPYLELFYLNITHPSDHSHLCSLTTSTLYWITTNTSATYTTQASCSLLHWLLTFSTYHSLDFIHIYYHTSILHVILPFIKPLN